MEETQENATSPPSEDPTTGKVDRRKHHSHLFWTKISWRFMSALIFSTIIMVTLFGFSRMGNLSRWEKRWFSVLAILASSLVSLSVGSLLGLLGNMLRWPLLACGVHTPMDVDLILGMGNPTGALNLIWQHTVKDRKWTGTTVAVTTYFFINIIGRLSVAGFGLTFDLNEVPGVDNPVLVTNWSTFEDEDNQDDYAMTGLLSVPTRFDPTNPDFYNLSELSERGLHRNVEGDKVTYSYFLNEFRGTKKSFSADKVLHSSSKCLGRTLIGHNVYEKGKLIANIDQTNSSSEEYLKVWAGLNNYLDNTTASATVNLWAGFWRGFFDNETLHPFSPGACETTYLRARISPELLFNATERNSTLFECTTCLAHGKNRTGLSSDVLFGLPSEHNNTVNILLTIGLYGSQYYIPPEYFGPVEDPPSHLKGGGNDTDPNRQAFVMRFYASQEENGGSNNYLNDGRGRQLMDGSDYEPPFFNASADTELYAAHLAARLPLLTVLAADTQLPRSPLKKGTSDQPVVTVHTTLEVRWNRALSVLVSILLGQLVAIGIVIYLCRNVFIRDHDSYLSIARLMKTVINTVDEQSTATGVELAQFLQEKQVVMRYGTRRKDDGSFEVDLWDDVEYDFPNAKYR